MTDSELQLAIFVWHQLNYPTETRQGALLAVGEELGELMRCQVKQDVAVRGTFEHWQEEKAKEVGDVLIGIINYCAHNGLDWRQCLTDRWNTISQRDFIANPETGGRERENDGTADGHGGWPKHAGAAHSEQ
jgi:NTP pyrophosphatase (non-canonical NTP hydrolase)